VNADKIAGDSENVLVKIPEANVISQQVIDRATERLVAGFHPDRVILFGSQAHGTADERSDVDLLVVCPFSGKRRALMVAMDRALRGLGFPRDVIVLTPEEFERDRHIPGTIARPASLEGKVLYERS
jgi:predicted nucleotidyltransferase